MLMYPLGFSFLFFFFGPVCVSFSHLVDLESEIPVCPSSVINSCVLFSRDVQMSVAFVGSRAVSWFCGGVSADGLQFSPQQGEITGTSWTPETPCVSWRSWIYFPKISLPEHGRALPGKPADVTQNGVHQRESRPPLPLGSAVKYS